MDQQELWQPGNDLAGAVDHGYRKADGAAQGIDTTRGIFGILDFGEDFAGAIQEQRAGVGHREASRGAQQQRDAEPRLQFADDARHRRLRQAKLAGGPGKAAALRGAHKHRQFLQPVTHSHLG